MIVIEPANLLTTLRLPNQRAAILPKRELASFLAHAAEAVGLRGQISVLLTDDETIRSLNRQFRKKDKATDVLSFPAADFPGNSAAKIAPLAGDIAISLETARRQAEACLHELSTEVKVLLLHGVLHLAGLDHETDTGQMGRHESILRKRFDLPVGLIQRSTPAGTKVGVKKQPARRGAKP